MEINRLRSDELTWELTIRACEVGSTVEQKRSQLRDALQRDLPDNPNVQLDPSVELSICSAKLDELVGHIQEFDETNRHNEFKRINSRLLHIEGRLGRVVPLNREAERKKKNLLFLLSGALEALDDANHIASLSQPFSSHAGGTFNSVNHSRSREINTSLLDSPNIMRQPTSEVSAHSNSDTRLLKPAEPAVAQLIDLETEQYTSPINLDRVEGNIFQSAQSVTSISNFNANFETDEMRNFARRSNQRTCMQLANRLNQISLQPICNQYELPSQPFQTSQHQLDRPFRRVSFATDVTGSNQENPLIESATSNVGNASFRNLNSTTNESGGENYLNMGTNRNPASTFHGTDSSGCCSQQTRVPVYKWNVSYNGHGSVTSFIEEVEQLADSRNISKVRLFHSVYELLRGDARDWYLPRKPTFTDWEDFKHRLREAFLPLNYEDNLLDGIKRRTQGSDERLILYVTRMQNLFKKLTAKRPPEEEQVAIIRKNLLPNLQTALAFQETRTIEELLSKGKEAEQIQWQAQQYCPPPTQPRLVHEPHLSYHRFNTNRHIPVRAIQSNNTEPCDQFSLSPAMEHSEPTSSTQPTQNSHQTHPRARNKTLTCWNCNQSGHKRSRCPQPLKLACFRCGQVGYTTRNCPACSKNVSQGN